MNDFYKSAWFLALAAFAIFYAGIICGKGTVQPKSGTIACGGYHGK